MSNDFDKQLEELEKLASQLEVADASDDAEVKTDEVADSSDEDDAVTEDADTESPDEEEAPEEKTAEADSEEDIEADEAEAEEDDEDDAEEKTADTLSEVEEKAQKIMSMMKRPKKADEESVFLTDVRFKEMEEAGELISDEDYDGLDDETKAMYERVEVVNEETKAGMGMRWRLRDMMGGKSEESEDAEEKGMHGDKKKGTPSVFLTAMRFKEMMKRGEMLDEEAYDKLDSDEQKGYEMVEVYNEKTKKGMGKCWRRRMPMEREQEVKEPAEKSLEADVESKTEESYLCGFQRKSVEEPCSFCRGGCAPEDGLPGLADIEAQIKSAYEGSTIISSGYSDADDMYIVDVKHDDGSVTEVFLSGEGKTLGWLSVDPTLVDESEVVDIISEKDAIGAALETIPGDAVSVMVDIFDDNEVYNIEIDGADQKSYDVYVSVKGEVLAYDVYDVDTDDEMTEEEEIKALEAELEMKRMYSREQREDMAESGEALPDGSYPIADKADLQNAIQAYGRAKDKEAAKAHIMKRAKELGLEEMLPENWTGKEEDESADDDGEKADDSDLIAALEEYNRLLSEIEGA